jgi:hypothetical protein
MKRIFGGKSGNSGGKVNRALKKPPSLDIKIRMDASNGRNGYKLESIDRAAIRPSNVSMKGVGRGERKDG